MVHGEGRKEREGVYFDPLPKFPQVPMYTSQCTVKLFPNSSYAATTSRLATLLRDPTADFGLRPGISGGTVVRPAHRRSSMPSQAVELMALMYGPRP